MLIPLFLNKKSLVYELNELYTSWFNNIKKIELKGYRKKGTDNFEEFILLTWDGGGYSTASNNANSLTATAKNVARMLDGGVYENWEFYTNIMESEDWIEV